VVNSSMSIGFHLAQVNLARAVAPLTDPRLADFVALLDEINELADRSPGFVWRIQTDAGNATDIQIEDDPRLIVNMSLWESSEALFDYVYKSGHLRVLSRRKEWFERSEKPSLALWWVPAGAPPTLEDGLERLDHLVRLGPSAHAFTFKTLFPAPAGDVVPATVNS